MQCTSSQEDVLLHKVGGQLLPPRIIRQGVDMGRAFSVFMFCFAMDPVYWHLNKIPDVVNVKGYVDDLHCSWSCRQGPSMANASAKAIH